ncbi:hypothetical protein ACX0G7_25480 [Flavitalea antarctica]
MKKYLILTALTALFFSCNNNVGDKTTTDSSGTTTATIGTAIMYYGDQIEQRIRRHLSE